MRLAARLARQEGKTHPKEWVDVYDSHNAFEWAVQMVLSKVEPWGDERADIREARNAAHIIASNGGCEGEDGFKELVKALREYLLCQQEPEPVVGARALRQALGDS